MPTATCSVCATTEQVLPINGILPDLPTMWSNLTIAERGQNVRNFLLCVRCTQAARDALSRRSEAHRDALTRSLDAAS